MRAGAKAGMVLATTFGIGALVGVLGGGAWRQRQNGPPPRDGGDGFVNRMEQVIRPRDSAQRASLRPMLEAADARNRRAVDGARGAMRAGFDTLSAQVTPWLDAAQRQRFEEFIRRPMRDPPGLDGGRGGRGGRGRGGPLPGENGPPPTPDGRGPPPPDGRGPPPP